MDANRRRDLGQSNRLRAQSPCGQGIRTCSGADHQRLRRWLRWHAVSTWHERMQIIKASLRPICCCCLHWAEQTNKQTTWRDEQQQKAKQIQDIFIYIYRYRYMYMYVVIAVRMSDSCLWTFRANRRAVPLTHCQQKREAQRALSLCLFFSFLFFSFSAIIKY